MPNVNRITSPYIVSGNPDTLNVAMGPSNPAPYAPGDLGGSFDYNDKTYCIVVLDPTNNTSPAGPVTANQVAFWKDLNNRIVTNDMTKCLTPAVPSSSVAGIFRVTIPFANVGAAGNLIAVLCRGHGIPVAAGAVAVGARIMADSTAATAEVVTATGVLTTIGVARTAANPASCDIDIPTLP